MLSYVLYIYYSIIHREKIVFTTEHSSLHEKRRVYQNVQGFFEKTVGYFAVFGWPVGSACPYVDCGSVGHKGKEFEILKFRSMCVGAEQKGSGVYSEKGDTRVTRVGKILRATSVDEFPQLLNVLLGHMSLVGPRPPLTYHPWPLDQYTDEQRRMFEVRPGLTGWAQVHGRKNVEWDKRIELNVWYVDHLSLWLDIKILFLTVWKVVANADNENVGATVNTSDDASKKEMVEQ